MKGVVPLNVQFMVGGLVFAAASIPMVLIRWRSCATDDDAADQPTDRDKLR